MNFKLSTDKENILATGDRIVNKHSLFPAIPTRNALGDISNKAPELEDIEFDIYSTVVPPPPLIDTTEEMINTGDSAQPLGVPGYVNEIYRYYKLTERDFTITEPYLERQSEINQRMRSILVDWLVDVHYRFKLQTETLYLTVNYIDRFLSKEQVARKNLQLVGVCAMLIAAKYEEIYFPEIDSFVNITDSAYDRDKIKKMEGMMLNTLNFDLTIPTINRFLDRYLKFSNGDEVLASVASYFAERTLQEYSLLPYVPSLIASSCILLSKQYLNHTESWNAVLEKITGYKVSDLLECSIQIENAVREGRPNLQAVWRKYTRTARNKASYLVHEKIGNTAEYMEYALRENR